MRLIFRNQDGERVRWAAGQLVACGLEAATQPNLETPAQALERVIFSF